MGYSATQQPVKTNGRIDLYVAADAVGASDINQGTTPSTPLKTINEAFRRCNVYDEISALFVIHVAPAPVAGYTLTAAVGQHILRESIVVIGDGAGQGGDGFTQLVASTAAIAGSSNAQIVTGGGFGTNTYRGKTIEVLTGPAAGDRRTIRDHTDTTLIPDRNFTAAIAATNTFRVVEPATKVVVLSTGATENIALGVGTGENAAQYAGNPPTVDPAFIFINISFQPASAAPIGWRFASSLLVMLGCEFAGTGTQGGTFHGDGASLLMGCQWAGGNANTPSGVTFGAPAVTSWSGWGCFFKNGTSLTVNTVAGFMVSGDGASIRNVAFNGETLIWMGGGSAIAAGLTSFILALGAPSVRVFIGTVSGIAPPVAFTNTGGTNAAIDIGTGGNIVATASVFLRNALLSAPVLLRTIAPVVVVVGTSTSVSGAGTTLGIDCGSGSQINCSGVTGLLGPAGADLSVDGGTTSVAAATLAAAGQCLMNQLTGAAIRRVI